MTKCIMTMGSMASKTRATHGGYSPTSKIQKHSSGQSIDHTDDLRPHGVDRTNGMAPQTKRAIRQFAWTHDSLVPHPGFPVLPSRRSVPDAIECFAKLSELFSSTRRIAVLAFILPLPCPNIVGSLNSSAAVLFALAGRLESFSVDQERSLSRSWD